MDADERRDDATGQSGESPLDTPAEEQAWDEAMHQAANERGHSSNPTGRFASESVAGLNRNQWPLCLGMRTHSDDRHAL